MALVLVAVASECAQAVTGDGRWRTVAVMNLRIGAVFALAAAATGWNLALAPAMEPGALLEWHRWAGTAGAAIALAAALTTRAARGRMTLLLYRGTLVAAGLLVAAAGHLGGLLVWGADFLRP